MIIVYDTRYVEFLKDIAVEFGDKRLNKRYWNMVENHMNHTQSNAAGPAPPVEAASSFAVTQATWRFLSNEKVTPQELVKPLREFARKHLISETSGDNFVLLVSDWCKLKYGKHTAKKDVVRLSHERNIGYELTTHLLVDAQTGSPIAPCEMHLKTATKVHSTRDAVEDMIHLDQLLPTMEASKDWDLPSQIVHVIDREADSVRHIRQWHGLGHLFLVRVRDRRVSWCDQSIMLSKIVGQLEFHRTSDMEIRGHLAYQEIAETTVILERPALRKIKGKQKQYPGEAIKLRFIVTQIRDSQTHELLSTWFLLSNVVSDTVPAERIAFWYYWRWHIESYFKLMKSAGMELDHWQQESGSAIMNRLLVASMAAVMVWNLQRIKSKEATEFKNLLVKLSGKTVKRTKPHTNGALLSGLFVLLRILDFWEQIDYDINKLANIEKQLKRFFPKLRE